MPRIVQPTLRNRAVAASVARLNILGEQYGYGADSVKRQVELLRCK